MNKLPHTLLRSGVYHYKRRVPTDLVNSTEFDGVKFIQYSLKTRQADVALRRLSTANQKFENRVARARSTLNRAEIHPLEPKSTNWRIPTSAEHDIALDGFYDRYHLDHPTTQDEYMSRKLANNLEPVIAGKLEADWENLLEELKSDGNLKVRSFDHAVRIYEENNWILDPDSKEFEIFCERLRRAERKAILQILDRSRSDDFTPSYEIINIKRRDADRSYTVTQAVSDYIDQNPFKTDMIKKLKLALSVWRQIVGKESFLSIDGRDVVDFVDTLKRVPKNAGVRFPGSSLVEAAAVNSELDSPYPLLTPKSIKVSYLGVLTTAANLALDRKKIGTNPFLGIRVTGSHISPSHRRPFKDYELKTIFAHPIFTGCASQSRRYSPGNLVIKDSLYWSPLIALFTGMRASEIGALRPRDLRPLQGTDSALWYISVEGTKSDNAIRDVPVHPGLIKLGLISLFENANAAGKKRVFEDWHKPKNKKYSEARVIRNFGEKVCGDLGDPGSRPSFHCFRHTLQTRMARSGIDPKFQRAILGHTQKGMEENYYKKDIHDYAVAFCNRVKFNDIDLTHLHER